MVDRRKPQQTPGIAELPLIENDDFTLPAALYHDAVYFCHQADIAEQNSELSKKERYARAAIYSAASFIEATINQTAFGHAQTHADNLG